MNKHHGNIPVHTRILMRGHHATGGVSNTMPSNTPIYKKGGSTRKKRSHHAEGDLTGVNPITGTTSPDIIAKKRGGPAYRRNRACHAEGDVVATPYKRGGKTKRRKHHEEGGVESMLARPRLGRYFGDELMNRKKGGSTHKKRRHHAEGEEVEKLSHGGRKKKKVGREKHNFGDVIGDIVSGAAKTAPMWLPLILQKGGPAKLAAGGVGKIRRGVMSKSGKILHAPTHAKMYNPR